MVTVVIVDDEPDFITVFSDFFAMNDITVLGFGNNGHDAVEFCVKHSPDYLILDLFMPKFDGFYALEKLSEMKNPTKIIVISGLLDEHTLNKLNEYKLFASFTKPVTPMKLVACMADS